MIALVIHLRLLQRGLHSPHVFFQHGLEQSRGTLDRSHTLQYRFYTAVSSTSISERVQQTVA